HILDFLVEKIDQGVIGLEPFEGVVTFHDPCRLGRMSGVYDAPRRVLESIPGLKLKEMPRSRENGACCGTTAWMNCSKCSGLIRRERINEARQTGATRLVTACPKCQIHFRCAKSAYDFDMEITDIYDLVADHMKIGS
ncbi:MAG: (Fe-S)-binding protein, partial [Pseudomonadota bacterium]